MEELVKFYKVLNEQYGDSTKSVGWTNESKCIERYNQGLKHLSAGSILEVGCGNGFFIDNFQGDLDNYNYTGIDVVEEFIKICSLKSDGPLTGLFSVHDILEKPYPIMNDNVIAIGVFSLQFDFIQDKYRYLVNALINCMRSSNDKVIVNGFHDDVDYRENHVIYYDLKIVAKILDLCSVKYKIIIGEGVLKHEFYLVISK